MYAVVETGGKQYKVSVGEKVKVEKLAAEVGAEIELGRVILVADDEGNITLGGKVTAKVLGEGRHKKIVVFKYKAKVNERKKQGHRQDYTEVEITAIA